MTAWSYRLDRIEKQQRSNVLSSLGIMGAQSRVPLKSLEPSQHYRMEGVKWGEPSLDPHYAERRQSL